MYWFWVEHTGTGWEKLQFQKLSLPAFYWQHQIAAEIRIQR
jgi:hypothetical protein